jgi:hypothetical protein
LRRIIRNAGVKLFFLPPYSPDLNPIENAFAKLKALPRKAAERSSGEQLEAERGTRDGADRNLANLIPSHPDISLFVGCSLVFVPDRAAVRRRRRRVRTFTMDAKGVAGSGLATGFGRQERDGGFRHPRAPVRLVMFRHKAPAPEAVSQQTTVI